MDIDSLSMELVKAMTGKAGSKGHAGVSTLPPKLKSKFHAWMKHLMSTKINTLEPAKKHEIYQEFRDLLVKRLTENAPLAKNEIGVTTHKNGVVKMEFGADVPEDVKKAALSWAKRRGLSPVDMKLAKSQNSPASHMFASGLSTSPDAIIDQYRWSF
jgi:hypothetical protein